LAGKFINTEIKTTTDSLIEGAKSRVSNNPFYARTDKKPTPVVFYNPDKDATSLDESTEQIYESVGPNSGLRFNKINGVLLYNIEKITLNIDISEFGPESSPIEGDAFLPPNTFKPYPEGYFVINYLGKNIFFRIMAVDLDTIQDGANFYKISYKLDNFDLDIEKQVVGEYEFISDNIGTDYKTVITNNQYKFIDSIQDITSTLIDYYNALFFKKRVQTYIFAYNDVFFYDPYMVEFIIRNNILNGGPDKYNYITQQVFLPQTFCIEYDKTIFRCLETKNNNYNYRKPYGIYIDDPSSLLTTRLEDYYMIDFKVNLGVLADEIDIFDNELISAIIEGKTFDINEPKEYYNIISSYFTGKDITQGMIDALNRLEYSPGVELFYTIPMIIFILNNYAIKLLQFDKNSFD
jgi:hypothetical protein